MVKIPPFDPITYLVGRRFPGLNGQEAENRAATIRDQTRAAEKSRRASSVNFLMHQAPPMSRRGDSPKTAEVPSALQQPTDRESEAASYRSVLLTYSQEQIATLWEAEREKHVDELAAQRSFEEQRRFFNQPSAKADFRHYCKRAKWSLDEAIALSLGKNPKLVNWTTVSPFTQVSAFAKEYEDRRDIANCAVWASQLFDPVLPGIFLPWANSKFDSLPPELLQTALDDGISFTGWKDLYESLLKSSKQNLADQAAQSQKHVEEILQFYKSELDGVYAVLKATRLEVQALNLKTETEAAPPNKPRPLRESERDNLQAMASLCAFRAYGFDPGKKNTASRTIHQDLASLGYEFSDDSISRHLRAGFTLLGPNWREKLKSKPKL